MRSKPKPLYEFEAVQYAVYLAGLQIQKEIESGVEGFISKYLRISTGVAAAVFLALCFAGVVHPVRWSLIGLKWFLLLWPVAAFLWTCFFVRQAIVLSKQHRKNFLRIYKLMLRNCLFRDDLCPLKKYKWHRYKNWCSWYLAQWLGTPGLATGYFLNRFFTMLIVPILLPWAVKTNQKIY